MVYRCSLSDEKNEKDSSECQTCKLRDMYNTYPAWISEVHGLGKIISKQCVLKKWLWISVLFCCIGGSFLTILRIIKEHKEGETSTFTSVKIVPSLDLPALTICPDIEDILNINGIYKEVQSFRSNITTNEVEDLIHYFLAGNGYNHMNRIKYFTRNYVDYIEKLYIQWSRNYTTFDFFFHIQKKYGINCKEFFVECYYQRKIEDCCKKIFNVIPVLGRGLCFQTIKGLKQQDEDDIGKLILKIKAPNYSNTNRLNKKNLKLIIYVNSDFGIIRATHPIYIFPNIINTLVIKARKIELIYKNADCLMEIEGNNNICTLKNWLKSKLIRPFNCTFSYLKNISQDNQFPICNLSTIVNFYFDDSNHFKLSYKSKTKCTPGCFRWQYFTTLQTGNVLAKFPDYHFNLRMSFMSIQAREHHTFNNL
uniref:Uncharacterized protein n=1 Tax=Strongyloides venezuelensis TaxID=75913 RepID=A0A0K0FYC2_STRVS